jgi:hypothetical protein
MDKLWFIQILEYSSVVNRNGLSRHEKNGRALNSHYSIKEVYLERLPTV